MKIDMHIILCMHAVCLEMHLKGNLLDLRRCILLASVVGSPHLVTLCTHAVGYTHVYLA